jgi:hypothetical protein
MNDTVKGIIIGIVSGLITSGIVYSITEKFIWNMSMPLWIWLAITAGIAFFIYITRIIIREYRVYNLISEFTEGRFGDSYEYTWKFKRSKYGVYRAFGYEATEIRLKKPLAEMNIERVHTFGHEVPEETIKMILQLWLIASMDKKMGERLKPVLEYLNWVENSQYHNLLH